MTIKFQLAEGKKPAIWLTIHLIASMSKELALESEQWMMFIRILLITPRKAWWKNAEGKHS